MHSKQGDQNQNVLAKLTDLALCFVESPVLKSFRLQRAGPK
jgi:hypothetical protein